MTDFSFRLYRNSKDSTIYAPDAFPTIQDAIDNASNGDTIIVRDGTCNENATIKKELIVQSENGPANYIVDAGYTGGTFRLSVDGITVKGFTATNSGYGAPNAGIEVLSVK